jgi:hypothetical protein
MHVRTSEGGDLADEAADSKPLTRGGKKSTRFKKAGSDEDDEESAASDIRAQAAARKAEMEKRKQEMEKVKQEAAKRAQEQGEIENAEKQDGGDGEAEEGGGVPASEIEAGETEGLKRKKDKITRFTKQQGEEDVTDDYGSLLEKHKENIPWVPLKKRLEQESVIYFRLGKRENVLKVARDKMREQGLYVAKERLLLPANVERELQRAKIQREAKAARSDVPLENKDAAHMAVYMGVKFHPEDEKFLMPFEPVKERSCRPSMRYDPSLPYLQYDTIVPVTVCKAFAICFPVSVHTGKNLRLHVSLRANPSGCLFA